MEHKTLRIQQTVAVAEKMLLRIETNASGVRLLLDGVWKRLTWLELSDWCFDQMDSLGMKWHLLPADAPDHWVVIAQRQGDDELLETPAFREEIDAVLMAVAWGLCDVRK